MKFTLATPSPSLLSDAHPGKMNLVDTTQVSLFPMTSTAVKTPNNQSTPATLSLPTADLTLDRGIPHLNQKTVRSLQQSITALQSAIAVMQQEILTLQSQSQDGENPNLFNQIQAKEQTLAILQTTLNQAELKLTALLPDSN